MTVNGIARVGDIGAHGNVLTTGSPNVLVNNRQAHRQFDLFICPIHGVGVTLLNCAPRVLVNNQQLAHVLSIGQDIMPAMIVQGSPNTFCGD